MKSEEEIEKRIEKISKQIQNLIPSLSNYQEYANEMNAEINMLKWVLSGE